MNIITHEKYIDIVKNLNNDYWNKSVKQRWLYLEKVAEIAKDINPTTAVEVGCFGVPIILDANTIDINSKQKPTYILDVSKTPYPFKDKQYDLFIALQVWEHLDGKQIEAFNEVKRISKNAILSFPYKWKNGHISHIDIDEAKISEWTQELKPDLIIIVHSRIIYKWSF